MDDMDAELARMINPAALCAAYALELRGRRIAAGLSREQLAELVQYPAVMIGMVEGGTRRPGRDFSVRCDAALRAGGRLLRLLPVELDRAYASWFRDVVMLEAEATTIHQVDTQSVAGLLQTEDYARATLVNDWPPPTDAEVERRLAARLDRQQILDRRSPPLLRVILTEAALHTPIGGDAVLRGQLRRLLDATDRPHVELRILSYRGAARCPLGNGFTVLDFADREPRGYLCGVASGQLIEEAAAVKKYAMTFEAIRARALSGAESADLIDRLLRHL